MAKTFETLWPTIAAPSESGFGVTPAMYVLVMITEDAVDQADVPLAFRCERACTLTL